MVAKKAMPLLANKEDANFREALKLYDAKQYKKALKLVETNLKKNSSHAESLALKGCCNYQLGNKSEAESYILKGIQKAPGNYLVNHLAGIYYRAVENYVDAAKWLKAANDNGSPNKPILRDLSFMQTQIRDYKNLRDSRQQFLEHQPGYRANWTAVAVAHHLYGDYSAAVSTLTKIENIIKDHLTDADTYEHSECLLYKNLIIAESGDYAKALEILEQDKDSIVDKLSFLEYKAKYLMLLGSKKEASLIYRQLLKRNPDNKSYYNLLEASLETLDKPVETRVKLYHKLATFYPRSDPPKFLPLTFVPASNPLFEELAKEYIIPQLTKGIPATFVNVKPLYKNKGKLEVIQKIVLEFFGSKESETDASGNRNPSIRLWTRYYLAQHYLYLNKLDEATEQIDAALKHSPTLVELYIVKARVLKHQGQIEKASEVMNEGRQLDLQDRFINSKATKYALRANKVNEAIDLISLFTKLDEDAVNGCKDLHVMQCNWVLVESAEAYWRLYKEYQAKLNQLRASPPAEGNEEEEEKYRELEFELLDSIETYKGLCLKRFQAVVDIFKIFYNDQYDFHSYCMRRGTPRDYVATLKWEDQICTTPIYTRVLKGLARLYFDLNEVSKNTSPAPINVKKNNKKQKKVQAQTIKKKADLVSRVESEKEDPDPLGAKLLSELNSQDIIEKLFELFKPLLDEGKDLALTWETAYRIYLIQGKYVLALSALKSLNKVLDPYGEYKHIGSIAEKVKELSQTSQNDTNANAAIVKVIEKGLTGAFPEYSLV